MKIAIVEDDRTCVERLKAHLARYAAESGASFSVDEFSDGMQFTEEKRRYDLVFLDIDMPILNGLDAAKELRKLDENAVIVFVTSLAQYALKGYEVNALDFMIKPVEYGAFAFTMKRAEKAVFVRRDDDLLIETKNGVVRVWVEALRYVEVQGHTLRYHLSDKVIETRGRLSDAEKRLAGKQFLRCNNCYLIHPRHIDAVKGYEVIVGGETLTISHPRKKQFMEELGRWYAAFGG